LLKHFKIKETTMNNSINRTYAIGGDLQVNRLGYGAMRLTGQPANFGPYTNWEQGVELLKSAVEQGVNFFDSAHAYGPQWADKIVGEALAEYKDKVVIATKGGVSKPAPDNIIADGSSKTLHHQIELALTNLNVDQIDLFQLHRVDPNIDIEHSVEALKKAQEAGKIRHIGLSNVSMEQLKRAMQVAPIASVQNRFNQAETRDEDMVDFTAENEIAFIPYGPLGAHPMKQGAVLNPREALAWLLKRSPNIVVIPGTTSIVHLHENMTAWDLV
jgi:aryl-alcohol dehydrogenase-like predicted oxidoreductase